MVDLGGAQQRLVHHHVVVHGNARLVERDVHALAYRVRLARGDDVVLRHVLLEHQPHRLHVVPGEPPVALGVQVPQMQLVHQPELDRGRMPAHLASHELQPPPRALVVE